MDVRTFKKNLAPPFKSGNWISWHPIVTMQPEFSIGETGNEGVLEIKLSNKKMVFGKWLCDVQNVKGGETYEFKVEYSVQNVSDETSNVSALLSWMAIDDKMLSRDYVENLSILNDGWRMLQRVMIAPDGAVKLKLELHFRWAQNGEISWRKPFLAICDPLPLRKIRIATTLIKTFRNTLEENLELMLSTIENAGNCKPDAICLTENVYDIEVKLPIDIRAETIPGRLTGAVSEKVKKFKSYIIFSMSEKERGLFYNTAVLIDREGNIAGKYRKIHLPLGESEGGIFPGYEYPVFDTDFGKVGMMICWDYNFPETARIMRLKGAEILFLPTAGTYPELCIARAIENGVYIVASGNYSQRPSMIINPIGQVLAELSDEKQGVCFADIDLNKRFTKHWMSVGDADGEMRVLYVKERRPDTYRILPSIYK